MTASSFDGWYAFVERPENDGNANDTAISNAGTGDGAGETRYGWILPTWRTEERKASRPDGSVARGVPRGDAGHVEAAGARCVLVAPVIGPGAGGC